MNEKGMNWKGAPFYSHLLPSLATDAWRNNRVAGDGWMAVGDAAGLVDPITGEGLYYAIRSADLAARALLSASRRPGGKAPAVPPRCCGAISRPTWRSASRLAQRFFLGRFLFASVPARMVQFTRRSPRFAAIMQDLFAGTQRLPGPEAAAAAQPQRHSVRDLHEPRVEPHRSQAKNR